MHRRWSPGHLRTQQKVNELSSENTQLKTENKQLKQKNNFLQRISKSDLQEIKNLENKIQNLENKLTYLEFTKVEQIKQLNQSITSLKTSIELHQEQIKKLNKQIQTAKDEYSSLLTTYYDLYKLKL